MRIVLSFLFICIILVSGQTQYLTPVHHDIQLQFTNLDYTGLYRSNDPFLYISTKKGLIRYDGKKFIQKSRKNDSFEISSLFHDGKKMWVGYEDGAIFTWQNQSFLPWNIEEGWPKSKISATGYIQKNNTFWMTTYGEGFYYHDGKHLYNINEEDGLGGNDIYCAVSDRNQQIYAATDKGLYVLKTENETKVVFPLVTEPAISGLIFTKLLYDISTENILGITYDGEVWLVHIPDKTAKKLDFPFSVRSGITIGKGKIYVIDEKGEKPLWTYDLSTQKTEKFTLKGLENDVSMIDLIIDHDGILWLLCKNNGLLSVQSDLIIYDVGLSNIQAITTTEAGIYIGDETGLYFLNHDGKQTPLLKNENIISLWLDEEKNILWAGTYGKGLIIMDLLTQKQTGINEKKGLVNNNIFSITSYKNEVWIATLAGIQVFDRTGKPQKKLTSNDGLPTDYIYTLYADKNQNLWIGTEGKGLILLSDGQLKTIVPDESIISVTEGKGNKIWFVSPEKGLGYRDGKTTSWYTKSLGLTSDKISGICTEPDGTLLVFHEFGYDKIDPVTLEILYSGNPTSFSKWKQNINSFSKNNNSNYYLGIPGHVVRFKRGTGTNVKPKLIANYVRCGNIYLKKDSVNILSHDHHNLNVDFSGIYFPDPTHLQFRYKLEPVESDWRYTRDPSLLYTELQPGTYTFTMEIGLANAFFPKEAYTFSFTINPPFYKTWWFILLSVTLLLVAGYVIIKYRIQQKKRISDIENEKVKMQLDTLKSQINPHFLFNSFNTLIGTIEENKQDAITYVEKLSDFYRNMLEYRDKNLISLAEELKIHDDYLFLLKQRFGKNLIIQFKTGNNTQGVYVIPLTLQLLTENAVKHNVISNANPLVISISVEGEYLVVSNPVRSKITKEKSTHFGLQSLSKRYKDLTNKEIQITVNDNIFSVSIPLQTYDTHIDH
ncbi:MAG: histidine kinase [Saprospiraceae bacterium]|nr:histidine kinase [Saprospiraceae bacterium]